ncbi:MAG: glycosyltransferase [Campylobacterota bacterium]|nr:glycosyltransferase [Campylobacterota bacterium]
MIKYISRHDKDYSRYNIIKSLLKDVQCKNDVYLLLPFSKNQFFKNIFKRDRLINDFFISNYDTYVYDRQKISKRNPRAWWKYFQDWVNFRYSKYLMSDTQAHFDYWESLFGKFRGEHFVLPVLADKEIYFPNEKPLEHKTVEVLFYGSFIPLHGIDVILKAFKILEDKQINFKAKIIGNGQMYTQMKDLYTSLGLKQVQMDGKLLEEIKLANEIRKTDIVLGVFGKSKKAASVVPNKVYQALACQKALITMQSDAIDEFFHREDLIQCDNTPEELANMLELLIVRKEARDRLAEHGHQHFLRLYDKTQENIKQFVYTIGKN